MYSHLYICGDRVVVAQFSELLKQLLTEYHKRADIRLLT